MKGHIDFNRLMQTQNPDLALTGQGPDSVFARLFYSSRFSPGRLSIV